jgi:hypothetical protein
MALVDDYDIERLNRNRRIVRDLDRLGRLQYIGRLLIEFFRQIRFALEDRIKALDGGDNNARNAVDPIRPEALN